MQRSYHAGGTQPPGPLQVGHAAKGLPVRGLCPQPVPGQRIAICPLQHNPSQQDNWVWPLREIPEDILMLTSGSSLSSRLFLFFHRFFNILIHHTAQSQPYPVHNVGFFIFFLPPTGNWARNFGAPMTLTVLLICWGFSWFLKALSQSYWERCKSLRIELMILQEWGALPSFSHRFLKQRLPYAWSWMSLL